MTNSTTIPAATPTLVLREDSFRKHPNGTVTGIVFWRVSDNAFPDDAWNDFVIIILGWWTNAIIRLLSGTTTVETMDLMDGPYSVICEGSTEFLRCRFVQRGEGEKVIAVWTGRTSSLAEQILDAAKIALRQCHHNSWMDSDITRLEEAKNTLGSMI